MIPTPQPTNFGPTSVETVTIPEATVADSAAGASVSRFISSQNMTPTQLNALLAYIDARAEQAEADGHDHAPARIHATRLRNELLSLFALPPGHKPVRVYWPDDLPRV